MNETKQLHKERRDTGGMFDAELGIQQVPGGRFRAYVTDGWGGGIQCFRDSEDQARQELERLFKKFYG